MSRIDETPPSFKTQTRRRLIPQGYFPKGIETYYSGLDVDPSFLVKEAEEMCDAQITVSEGHPFWADFKDRDGLKPDLGGNFETTRWSPIVDKTVYAGSYVDSRGRLWQASGPIIPSIKVGYSNATNRGWGYISRSTSISGLANYFPAVSDTDNQLLAYGTTAIARTRPDQSPSSVTQFLVELKRDGIPFRKALSKGELRRLVKEFEEHGVSEVSAKRTSNYFLENQFGLRPFVSDLRSFVESATNGLSVLDDLRNNSGKLIRRRYKFPEENLSTTKTGRTNGNMVSFSKFPFSASGDYFNPGGNDSPFYNTFWDVNTSRKTWFSGAYRIYMPTDMEPVSRLRSVVDHLRWDYGVSLDFATIWNLAPWTWLLDWELNLGDLILGLSKWSQDAVVLHYGYIMQETKSVYMCNPQPGSIFAIDAQPHRTLPGMGVTVHKKRRLRATPYGFGLAYGSLSTTQKAILAAIGITRF